MEQMSDTAATIGTYGWAAIVAMLSIAVTALFSYIVFLHATKTKIVEMASKALTVSADEMRATRISTEASNRLNEQMLQAIAKCEERTRAQ